MKQGLELLGWGSLLFSVGVLVVALLRPLLRRLAGAVAQYQLWLLIPAVLVAAGLASLQPERPLRWQIELPAEEPPSAPEAASVGPAQAPAVRPAPPAVGPGLLMGAWLLGALGCTAVWGLAHRRLLRGRRLAAGSSAALVGVWRPRLRLPVDFRARFPSPERRLILLHERLHAERGDTRWLLLALALVALQWFNPAAWWALRRLRADMELACDAALLRRQPGQLKTYRQALLRAQGLSSRLPLSATPCSTHPLIERLSMLPLHSSRAPRRGIAAILIALAAGLAYAAQPSAPVAPAAPAVPAAPAAEAPAAPKAVQAAVPALAPKAAPAVQAVRLPAPPAPRAQALPTPTAVTAPEPPTPPAAVPMLRTDVRLTIGGQALEEAVLLEAFDKSSKRRFKMPNGQELELDLRGLPADESRFPKDSIQMTIGVVNLTTGEVLAKPRLVTGNGIEARIERGQQRPDGSPDPDFIRIDLLSRKVQSATADAEAAQASLQRDIEAGRAPAPFKR